MSTFYQLILKNLYFFVNYIQHGLNGLFTFYLKYMNFIHYISIKYYGYPRSKYSNGKIDTLHDSDAK